jgi:hypothetical protein
MNETTLVALTVLGALHGFVVWVLLFKAVGPVVRLIVRQPDKLVVSAAIAWLVVMTLLVSCAFLLLQGLGSLVSPNFSREKFFHLWVGSMGGLIALVLIQRVEAALRRRR